MHPAEIILKATAAHDGLSELLSSSSKASGLFINAPALPALRDFHQKCDSNLICQSYWRPAFKGLERLSLPCQADIPDQAARFDYILLHFPKNMTEGKNLLAKAFSLVKADGYLVVGAANDANGKRLEKLLKAAGFACEKIIKARCTVCIAGPFSQGDIIRAGEETVTEPAFQPVLDNRFISAPGIFGWDKVDKGSALLAAQLPRSPADEFYADFSGKGADFGCGYGFLSAQLLEVFETVSHLYAADADWRAVEACGQNLAQDSRAEMLWRDLTTESLPDACDFIVMNPPFHSGKDTAASLGVAFITKAAETLRKGGVLWLVANSHLPYERSLNTYFATVEAVKEEEGFKIIRARK